MAIRMSSSVDKVQAGATPTTLGQTVDDEVYGDSEGGKFSDRQVFMVVSSNLE
jgi:hypothetical protein